MGDGDGGGTPRLVREYKIKHSQTPIATTTSGSKVHECGSRAPGTRRAIEAHGFRRSHGSHLACLLPIATLRLASSATVNSMGTATRRSWPRQYRPGRSGLPTSSPSLAGGCLLAVRPFLSAPWPRKRARIKQPDIIVRGSIPAHNDALTKEHVYRLERALDMPVEIRSPCCGSIMLGIEALIVVLARNAYPSNWPQLRDMFGVCRSKLSGICNATLRWIDRSW